MTSEDCRMVFFAGANFEKEKKRQEIFIGKNTEGKKPGPYKRNRVYNNHLYNR